MMMMMMAMSGACAYRRDQANTVVSSSSVIIINHAIMPVRSFREHIRSWMRGIAMPMTEIREVFLRRYEVLLILRGISPYLLGPRQAAMEVLLNLSRSPVRREHYLKAVVRKMTLMIRDILVEMAIPANDGTEWDVPNHIIGSGFRFAVIEDPVPGVPEGEAQSCIE
jgi:hypothetical protein